MQINKTFKEPLEDVRIGYKIFFREYNPRRLFIPFRDDEYEEVSETDWNNSNGYYIYPENELEHAMLIKRRMQKYFFKKNVELHKVKYNKIIAEGDEEDLLWGNIKVVVALKMKLD